MAIAGNLLAYNVESIETSAAGWTAVSGCTIARSTTYSLDGVASLKITSTTTGDIAVRTATQVAVTPGTGYRIYGSLATLLSSRGMVVQVDWYNASHTLLTTAQYPSSGSVPLIQNEWTWTELDAVAPAGAAFATVTVRPQAGASADAFYFDEVALIAGIATLTATPNTANAYVSLALTNLTSYGADTLTITRTDPDGSQTTVRGADGVNITSLTAWAGFDYEAPLNAMLTYTATLTAHAGGVVTAAWTEVAAPVQITVPDTTTWLKSLSQPALSRQVILTPGQDDVTRPARQQRYDVAGRRNAVTVSDVRAGREGQLAFVTFADEDGVDLEALFDGGDVLFLQSTPDMGMPDLYFASGDLVCSRPSAYWPEVTRLWTVDFVESDAPSGQLTSLPGNSWLAVVSFGTWQHVKDNRSTWLDVLNRAYGS